MLLSDFVEHFHFTFTFPDHLYALRKACFLNIRVLNRIGRYLNRKAAIRPTGLLQFFASSITGKYLHRIQYKLNTMSTSMEITCITAH